MFRKLINKIKDFFLDFEFFNSSMKILEEVEQMFLEFCNEVNI